MKNLLNGDSTSCGCVKDRFAYKGLSKQHPELYKCWTNMRERCLNPGNDAYKFYGGKGVTIRGEWCDARENILRAGRILHDEDENRLTALRTRTGQSVADIAELALDAFLPPLQGTPGWRAAISTLP